MLSPYVFKKYIYPRSLAPCAKILLLDDNKYWYYFLSTGICSYPGPTESETTQSGSITGRNDTQNNSENLDKNSAFLYIVIGCSAAVGAIVAITVALLGAIVIRLICIKTSMYM